MEITCLNPTEVLSQLWSTGSLVRLVTGTDFIEPAPIAFRQLLRRILTDVSSRQERPMCTRIRFSATPRAALLAALLLGGCEMPQDPEGTLQRVRGGTLRVGVSVNAPWTAFDGTSVSGLEPELLDRFADELGAEVEWIQDTEGDLLPSLERGEIDIVICGLHDDTPWKNQVALTRPFLAYGGKQHVMAVVPGENRFLLQLDRFLQAADSNAMAERLSGGEL
jgi:polar amino acid transport system substrate-binding protein